jgi:hypothetical protein
VDIVRPVIVSVQLKRQIKNIPIAQDTSFDVSWVFYSSSVSSFVGLNVPALPSSAVTCRSHASYLPYLVVYSLCISNPIHYCRVSSPLSTGYGPRPDAIDDFSRQLPLFSRPRLSSSYSYHRPTLRILYRIFVRHRFSPPVSERASFSRGQEPDSL